MYWIGDKLYVGQSKTMPDSLKCNLHFSTAQFPRHRTKKRHSILAFHQNRSSVETKTSLPGQKQAVNGAEREMQKVYIPVHQTYANMSLLSCYKSRPSRVFGSFQCPT